MPRKFHAIRYVRVVFERFLFQLLHALYVAIAIGSILILLSLTGTAEWMGVPTTEGGADLHRWVKIVNALEQLKSLIR